jgi:hypothetical protein
MIVVFSGAAEIAVSVTAEAVVKIDSVEVALRNTVAKEEAASDASIDEKSNGSTVVVAGVGGRMPSADADADAGGMVLFVLLPALLVVVDRLAAGGIAVERVAISEVALSSRDETRLRIEAMGSTVGVTVISTEVEVTVKVVEVVLGNRTVGDVTVMDSGLTGTTVAVSIPPEATEVVFGNKTVDEVTSTDSDGAGVLAKEKVVMDVTSTETTMVVLGRKTEREVTSTAAEDDVSEKIMVEVTVTDSSVVDVPRSVVSLRVKVDWVPADRVVAEVTVTPVRLALPQPLSVSVAV